MTAQTVFVHTMTMLTMAVIPWVLALSATRWMPKAQTAKAKRTYRAVTAAGAIIPTTAALLLDAPLLWLLPIAAAAYLTVHWFRYSRTPKGRYLLQSAKAEQERNEAQANRMYELPKEGW